MRIDQTIDSSKIMGERHSISPVRATLEELLQKARLLGFSESEIVALRRKYGPLYRGCSKQLIN